MAESEEAIEAFLRKGIAVAGSATGQAAAAIVGGTLAGPPGALAGAAVGKVCEIIIEDLANRYLSNREEVRVSGVAALAVDDIRERLMLGAEPRQDDFFNIVDGNSPAQEIFEGVLLSAKQEHEQKKLPYLAKLFSNLTFKPYFKQGEANHLLTVAESLTYQQFCILAIVARREEFDLRQHRWPENGSMPAENLDLAQQAFYLYQRQLLLNRNRSSGSVVIVLETTQFEPANSVLSPTGLRLCELLGLESMPIEELSNIAPLL